MIALITSIAAVLPMSLMMMFALATDHSMVTTVTRWKTPLAYLVSARHALIKDEDEIRESKFVVWLRQHDNNANINELRLLNKSSNHQTDMSASQCCCCLLVASSNFFTLMF